MKKIISFSILGAGFGVPLSYYFQPEFIRITQGLYDYIKHFDKYFYDNNYFPNIIVGIIAFAVIGGILGFYFDTKEQPKL